LDAGPFAACGEERDVAAVEGLGDDIGLIGGVGVHVGDGGDDDVGVLRKGTGDDEDDEERELCAKKVAMANRSHRCDGPGRESLSRDKNSAYSSE
jgi:hypothetical protein